MEVTASTRANRSWWWAAILLATVGVGLAIELTRIHLRLQSEPTHQSFCNLSASVNCDAVATSRYAVMLGLPVSVWGCFTYLAVLVTSLWGLRSNPRAAAALLWVMSAVCTASAVWLAVVSAFVLKTWCLLCMVTWVIDLGLFVVANVVVRESGLKLAGLEFFDWCRKSAGRAASWGLAALVILGVTYRTLPHAGGPFSQTANAASLATSAPLPSGKPPEGVDDAGQPYVGAKSPKLVITEFSDYQCPHCARAHQQLRILVARYPDAIRVVHRHFPLDNDCNPKIPRPFHTHACYYARLAVCAATLGKFWQGNDYLFAQGQSESAVAIESFARNIDTPADKIKECLANRADVILKRDVEAGAKLNINGTPTFIIDGEMYTGELPPEVLRDYPL